MKRPRVGFYSWFVLVFLALAGPPVAATPSSAAEKTDAALLQAIDQGDTDGAVRLLKQGASANTRDAAGRTALMYAAITGQTQVVMKALLDRGADVNARSSDGTTALIAASTFGDPKAIRMLLSKGAEVNARDSGGETALTWAKNRLRHAPTDRSLFPKMPAKNNYGDFTFCTKEEFEQVVELLEGAGGEE